MGGFAGFSSAVTGKSKGGGGDDSQKNSDNRVRDIIKGVESKLGKKSQKAETTDKSPVPSYHKGGLVRKTGLARLKRGERVLTKSQQKGLRKRMRGKR